ncbi:MAG: transporter [Pseudonocardiales bacterium]|nr:transporter [Pseudonocardiales bacterium]
MSWWTYVALLAAGLGGGMIGSVAGLASLISYPVLLAIGLPPVTANVTNTVALVSSSAGSISGSRIELAGQADEVRRLGVAAVLGGIVGGVLLLVAPADSFEFTVPWLIGGASLAIMAPRREPTQARHRFHGRAMLAGTALIGVYSGYFGAAAGVLMLSLLLGMTHDTFARANATKNVLVGAANAVAAIAFAFFGPVRWLAALPLAVGCFIGGRLGPIVVRRVPATPLRLAIALAGVGLAIDLGWQAYR